jgi:hypothetical protein
VTGAKEIAALPSGHTPAPPASGADRRVGAVGSKLAIACAPRCGRRLCSVLSRFCGHAHHHAPQPIRDWCTKTHGSVLRPTASNSPFVRAGRQAGALRMSSARRMLRSPQCSTIRIRTALGDARYRMRRVDCKTCGVRVEIPRYMLFLADWARMPSWKDTANSIISTPEKCSPAVSSGPQQQGQGDRCESPMVSAPSESPRSLSTTRSATCPSHNSPTDSIDEPL